MDDTNLALAEGLSADPLRLACGNAQTRVPEGLEISRCPVSELESLVGIK